MKRLYLRAKIHKRISNLDRGLYPNASITVDLPVTSQSLVRHRRHNRSRLDITLAIKNGGHVLRVVCLLYTSRREIDVWKRRILWKRVSGDTKSE